MADLPKGQSTDKQKACPELGPRLSSVEVLKDEKCYPADGGVA